MALTRLLTWVSPSFPVGAFSYSHGLEWAVEADGVTDRATLEAWIAHLLTDGSGRTDAMLCAAAWRAENVDALAEIAELARALSPSTERALETDAQGAAFRAAIAVGWPDAGAAIPADAPYPVAVGAAARAAGLELEPTLIAFLHAFAANVISAGLRAIPLGQSDGVRMVSALEPVLIAAAAAAVAADPDDLGGFAPAADVASLLHETQYTRLFRS
ncbi:MAG: urease accessory protein UreF [Pseudomonadota bacterium]